MSRKAPIPTPRILPPAHPLLLPNSHLDEGPLQRSAHYSLVDKGRGGTVIGIEWEGRRQKLRGLGGVGGGNALSNRKDVAHRGANGSGSQIKNESKFHSGSTDISQNKNNINKSKQMREQQMQLKSLLISDRPLKYSASDECTSNQGSTSSSSHSSNNEENDVEGSIPDLMGNSFTLNLKVKYFLLLNKKKHCFNLHWLFTIRLFLRIDYYFLRFRPEHPNNKCRAGYSTAGTTGGQDNFWQEGIITPPSLMYFFRAAIPPGLQTFHK